ncbi:protein translocase subunit SecDF [Winogradskyella maritima]|uniref:Multifunctional fusion protein n=1 Tax=Winogradskyella maritima TaxID=1517766 RepID=A0ABV8AK81_9FLAO|nr:protein translocase subunit SecDF [Winogradskyella maritima]
MQNKGIVKLFAILFGLVSIYQLSFTFKANQLESEAEQFAQAKYEEPALRADAEARYLDSISTTEVYNLGVKNFTYNEVKDNAMNLGLDLKGGINAIIQISVKDILKGLANNSKDPVFNQALEQASEDQKDSQDSYLESFFSAFDEIKGDTKLASPDIFANRSLEEIEFDMSDDEVKTIIERKVDESIVSAFEVLRSRIDGFGVTSPNIQRLGNTGRILIELPGVKDKERAIKVFSTTAQLQFWETFKTQDLAGYLLQVNQRLVEAQDANNVEDTDETEEATTEIDSTDSAIEALTGQIEQDSTAVDANDQNPLRIQGLGQGGPIIGTFLAKDRDYVLAKLEENRDLLGPDYRYARFAWEKPADEASEFINLYALKSNREDQPQLSGSVITDARQDYDQYNKPAVSMQMNAKGAKIWEEMTREANETQGNIAIVLDNIVYSAPGVTTPGGISGGNSQISGSFKLTEAIDLANVLRAGKLPASAEIIQAEEIGPSLGQEAIDSGMRSFLIALAFVLIWMIFYYGKGGGFADIALLLNILLIFGVLSGLGAVLTLPGIAGIVLTIGISVDANVLIFERIREELYKGKDQKAAIKDGFANALSSILDANITTGLTALILFLFGTGPIKGFATTLIIGILTSLFTAIFITRLMVDWYVNRGGKLEFSTALTKGLFRNVDIKFLQKRKIAYVISGLLIAASLFSLFTNKLDAGIDFVGGRTYQVRFDQQVSTEEVTSILNDPAVFGSAEVKTIGDDNQLKISTKYKVEDNTVEADEEVQSKLFDALRPLLPDGMTYQEFLDGSGDLAIGKMSSSKVSPTIADDIQKSSFWAILGSLVVVFLYILIRFKRWQFSLGAVAAVFHDVLIVLGIFSLTYKFMPFSMEIDQAFIAAILTVIGYSLNDTVVVFDRIREFLNEHTSWPFGKTINASLNSTLSRTLNTSLTTLVVLLAMFFLGADSLRGFLFALIVGVLVGTYSSLFIATPIMYDTAKKGDAAESLKKKVVEEEEEV